MSTGTTSRDRHFFEMSSVMAFLGVVLIVTRQGHEKLFVLLATALFFISVVAALRGAHYWPFQGR